MLWVELGGMTLQPEGGGSWDRENPAVTQEWAGQPGVEMEHELEDTDEGSLHGGSHFTQDARLPSLDDAVLNDASWQEHVMTTRCREASPMACHISRLMWHGKGTASRGTGHTTT